MESHERIKLLRVQKNMTQKELGEKIGVSAVSIRHWESGTKNPSMSAIIALAKIFNQSSDYLLGIISDQYRDDMLMDEHEIALLSNYRTLDKHGKMAVDSICAIEKSRVEEMTTSNTTRNIVHIKQPTRYIPRYTTPTAAGYSVPLDGDDFEMIVVDESVPYEADFAVSVQGDSMAPYIHDGDTVYVKKGCDLSVGDVGIFCVDGAMYCKQYYIDNNQDLILVSANENLKHTNVRVSLESNSSFVCYGKVLLGYRIDLPNYIVRK